MKCLKMLGLAAIAASALMAFAGSASATTLTNGSGAHYPKGSSIHAESEGHVVLDSLAGKIECNSTMDGSTSSTGGLDIEGRTTDVSSGIGPSFTGCTTATVHVIERGTLTITSAGGNKGTLVSSGLSVTVVTFGLHCGFTTGNTAIGTVTGGTPAKLDISGSIPRTYGTSGAFCGSGAPWTGSYKVTTPSSLFLD